MGIVSDEQSGSSEHSKTSHLAQRSRGNFPVIGLFPNTRGRNQSRVESTSDRHRRVVGEHLYLCV